MKVTLKLEGLAEVEARLGALIASADLSKAQGRAVYGRGLVKAAALMVERMRQLAPRRSGALAESLTISRRTKNNAGKEAFKAARKAGLSSEAAGQAARAAGKAAKAERSAVEAFVGPASRYSHLGHWVEFGTKPHKIRARKARRLALAREGKPRPVEVDHPGTAPRSFMRAGFAETAAAVLAALAGFISAEISAALQRKSAAAARGRK